MPSPSTPRRPEAVVEGPEPEMVERVEEAPGREEVEVWCLFDEVEWGQRAYEQENSRSELTSVQSGGSRES